jgi:hypothetical protein
MQVMPERFGILLVGTSRGAAAHFSEAGTMHTTYVKHERLWIKDCPGLSERWVQDIIEEDPKLLHLGDLELRDRERIQLHAGRLDLLLQHPDTQRRYEVELQLGPTDESHIVRTIEYWDIERRRYPQYDHCAVIVAEDITSRFLNVISLFNGNIPLIAIQMQLIKMGDQTTLVFTTVVSEVSRGLVDEDEVAAPADRPYWENRASKATVELADKLLSIVHQIDPALSLKYNKNYIVPSEKGQTFKFVTMSPKKGYIRLRICLSQSEYVDSKIDSGGLDTMEYRNGYRLRLSADDVSKHESLLLELIKMAHDEWQNR